MNELLTYSIAELTEHLSLRRLSSLELTLAYLDSIAQNEPSIDAFITLTPEIAIENAKRIDEIRVSSATDSLTQPLSALAGIPFAIKDNICTKGIRTTCASKMLENFIAPYSATVYERLSDSILLGKLNMDEFGMGSTTESSYFHPTHNPHRLEYTPGGSSGGAAAAVVAGEAPFALASDTGGSIRQPSAFCGAVGMCPSYGRVSRYGLVAFASSLDRIGPITRKVRDNALILDAIAGLDACDSTSIAHEGSFTEQLGEELHGLRIGIPTELDCSKELRETIKKAALLLERLGARLVEVDIGFTKDALAAYYVISSAEASSNLARYDGIRYGHRANADNIDELITRSRSEGFGDEVKRRILLGTFALSAGYADEYYGSAVRVRELIKRGYDKLFCECDLLLTPSAPTAAFRLGEKRSPLELYAGDIYTVPASLAGLCALSLPFGENPEGLPLAVQLTGRQLDEATVYRAAYALEDELAYNADSELRSEAASQSENRTKPADKIDSLNTEGADK